MSHQHFCSVFMEDKELKLTSIWFCQLLIIGHKCHSWQEFKPTTFHVPSQIFHTRLLFPVSFSWSFSITLKPLCSYVLLPVSLSRSSDKCSFSLVGLASSAGRTLLARRASGAVVECWLVAAWEGWRQYTRLKYQLGIQTHPWTKRGFLGLLFFSLCVCVGTSACTCTHSDMFAYAACLCVFGHTAYGRLFSQEGCNTLHLCTTQSMLIQTAHTFFTYFLSSENRCSALTNDFKREFQHNRLLAFQLRCYIIAVDTSCVR